MITQIAVGCEVRKFADWLKNYKIIGKQHNFTPEQIKEYGEVLKYLVKAAEVYVERNKKSGALRQYTKKAKAAGVGR